MEDETESCSGRIGIGEVLTVDHGAMAHGPAACISAPSERTRESEFEAEKVHAYLHIYTAAPCQARR